MTTNQILDEQKRELEKVMKLCYDNGVSYELDEFFDAFSRKLIESLAEEIIRKDQRVDYCADDGSPYEDEIAWERNKLRSEQRLKVKEILSNLK